MPNAGANVSQVLQSLNGNFAFNFKSSFHEPLSMEFYAVNTKILVEYFKILDVHNKNTLNDVQFTHFMREVTNFGEKDIIMTFDMLDWNASGEIGFQQFYMLVCILLSSQHHVEKNFIFLHSRPVFELLDMDGGRTISPTEFRNSAFLFNLKEHALSNIFYQFDVSGDEHLNYKEFKMFTMACIYMQEEEIKQRRRLSFRRVHGGRQTYTRIKN